MSETLETLEVDLRLALDPFALDVTFFTRRAVTGIFGPSGSGKTSLLEAVAGLRRWGRGSLRLGGQVWLDAPTAGEIRRFVPPERRHIGYVPQDGLLFPHRSVRRNLLAGATRARRRGERPEELLQRVAALLELEPLLERDVPTLSGGERQRVALGRALCSGPRLLLLDEPLASLDLPLRRRLLPFLRRVREELTVPMLLVSHDPVEVQALCDDLLVLRRGRILARGEPRRVLTDPEVFPLAEREGYENILPGRLVGFRGHNGVVALGSRGSVRDGEKPDGVELVTGPTEAGIGEEVLVSVAATDILLATTAPEGLSARNVLPARVGEIRSLEDAVLVTADLTQSSRSVEAPPLAVEITEATPAELGLASGREIYLVIKAMSCRVLG